MTHPQQRANKAPRSMIVRATPVALAAAAVISAIPSLAFAQTTETVVVTGIRRGIESALSQKKNADGVVEAISAEDIGKLPDTTIAESLARLPGVTAQRDRNGNATNISIRGLGPDFNGYLLNGREQTSTGDSRSVDLSVYPAELIGSALVYKTGDASLMAAGLAGTLDNRLIDPLAFSRRVIAANVGKTKNGVGLPETGKGTRYSLAYVDQFLDRTLGVAVGFVSSKSNSNSLANGSWGSTVNVTPTGSTTASRYDVPFAGGFNFESDNRKDERTGLAAILSYKPNKAFNTELDVYSAKIKTALKKVKASGAPANGGALTNATVVGGVVTAGTFALTNNPTNSDNNAGLIIYNENIFDDDKIDSLGWRSTWKFAEGWAATFDVSSNKAKRIEKDIEAYGGITGADTLSFTNGGGTPQFTLGRAAEYVDPARVAIRDQTGWSGVNYPAGTPTFANQRVPQAGYKKGPTITDKIDALRFDLRRDLAGVPWVTDVQFGANFSKRTKDRLTDEGLIVSTLPGGYGRIALPGNAYVATNIGGTGLNLLTFDPTDDLWAGATVLRKYNDDILAKTWGVAEKTTTAYVKANIDTTISSIPVTGNVGVQVVSTNQSSTGYRSSATSDVSLTNPAGTLVSDGTTYTDVLPSLNLRADLGRGNVARFGLGQQIARATLTDLRNSYGIGRNNETGQLVASAGNPQLKPFKALALDLSFEHYLPKNQGIFAVAGFYKKLDTYITQNTVIGDLRAQGAQYGVTQGTAAVVGRDIYTAPINGKGGNVHGIEVAGSLSFGLLTSALEGFGVQGSYSVTASSVQLPYTVGLNPTQQVNGSITMQMPNLSKQNSKIVVYYERAGFSAFWSENRRTSYLGNVSNSTTGGYPALVQIDAQRWVSAQIGYEFQSGPMKGLGLRFEGNNINKPVYREFNGRDTSENKTGATYGLKLSYKLQ
jgi:iron complex outermembrane recepter protein